MVRNGYSLLELKQLDIDEFYSYVEATFYTLEQAGEIKKGTHDKITGEDNTVDQLRFQLSKIKK